MKDTLQSLLQQSLESLAREGVLPADHGAQPHIERTRDEKHGDLATNLALTLAKVAGRNPRELAQLIIDHLPSNKHIRQCEIAGPGFINFFLSQDSQHGVIGTILEQGAAFGRSKAGAGQRVQVEFVSANPTGPLHVGHGRGAAYGATVADLLEAAGFDVHREYYVNDAGRQMDILAASVWLRYLELGGAEYTFPSNGYKGDYVQDIAASLRRGHGDALDVGIFEVFDGVPEDAQYDDEGKLIAGDKEAHIDGLIESAKTLLRDDQYRLVFDTGLNYVLDDIRDDLEKFGVSYDEWYSERSLTDSGAVERALMRLREAGYIYEQNGAEWFKSTAFGDEKDRVVVRDNGQTTYFASDIAYHMDKLDRGFERVIDIWGADHHGYIPRVKAALSALGDDPNKLDVLLVQFAILYRGGEKAQMSTRSGEFITLRQLRKEVGNDATRFFYVMRKAEQHLDFDMDLAKSQSKDNPLYYIQYAHARVCSVMREATDKGLAYDEKLGLSNLGQLGESHEQALMSRLAQYPELLERAALNHEPHQLVHFLRDLANDFHTYYNAHKALVDDDTLRCARLVLFNATRQVVANGLTLLGVSAPEKM